MKNNPSSFCLMVNLYKCKLSNDKLCETNMNLKKLFFMLMMSIMLGQAVLASADMHLVFEETDTHHSHSEFDSSDQIVTETDHSGDDCGHCCHAHGCNLVMVSDSKMDIGGREGHFYSGYLDSFYFAYSDPAHRPPIA